MYSIDKNVRNEIVINKSKFITCLFKINDINDIDKIFNDVKNEYKDATHYCYAYILDGNMKCSDDGEPSKTAGAPLLNVLKKNKLNHVLVIVIRYFGGIKLGTGGLVRAYTKSITECLNLTNITESYKGYLIEITFNHSNIKQVDYILKDENIIKKFGEVVIYEFYVKEKDLEIIQNKLNQYILKFKLLGSFYLN